MAKPQFTAQTGNIICLCRGFGAQTMVDRRSFQPAKRNSVHQQQQAYAVGPARHGDAELQRCGISARKPCQRVL